MEKSDADFVVYDDYTIDCTRYYSSYIEYKSMYSNPVETNAKFSTGTRLSNGLKYYEINTDYAYRKSMFWKDSTFSMSLTCDISGGTQ